MPTLLEQLQQTVSEVLADQFSSLDAQHHQLVLTVAPARWLELAAKLRDHPQLEFEQLIDLCGMDYAAFGDGAWEGKRFAAVYQLLSVKFNRRLRVKVFAADDDFPLLPSVVTVWPAANWFEREAFDLFGLMFEGHPDLRRLLTDYGFIGHPFRKDFPLSGHVEMRYDPDQKRVIYQPVTIEPREVTPRIIREENYGDR